MNRNEAKRRLEEVFVSTFHNKLSFKDFLELDVSGEYHRIELKKRNVYAPSLKLKQIHRFINKAVLEFAEYNTHVVFSYRKSVSIRDAVKKHSTNNVIFQTDLSNFYGSIHLENVRSSLMSQLSDVFISDIDKYINRIIELTVVDDQIPAGFATSPLLSNICLYKFDNALLMFCEERELTYTRYSDDIIISGKDREGIENIENKIDILLNEHIGVDVKLNKCKTKINKKGHNFKILGFKILPNGIVTIPSKDKKEVELLLYFYLTDSNKFEDYAKNVLERKQYDYGDKTLRNYAINMLSGKLIAFNSMDKEYILKLRKKYGNTVIDMFIRKSVK